MSAERFTVGEVEEEVRRILLDTYDGSYRFTPDEIFRTMVSGIDHIHRVRPSSRYVNGLLVGPADNSTTPPNGGLFQTMASGTGAVTATRDDANLPNASDETISAFRANAVNMERTWFQALVYYVVHRMYLKDDPDTENANLAARYLELLNGELG